MNPRVRIVGCGRWSMGDDRAGLAVCEHLLRYEMPHTVIETTESPATVFAEEENRATEALMIIDAAPADRWHPPGSFARLDGRALLSAGEAVAVDTHTIGVQAGLALAEALSVLPPLVMVYAIFGTRFERDAAMSGAVERVVPQVAEQIARDVGALSAHAAQGASR